MDYEKKYKEALERAKELYEKRNNSCFVQDQIKGEAALKIFPEIKENKDILKILIKIFQTQYRDSTYSAFPYEGLITGEEILAWLEKQGEQKETLCDKCKREQPSHSCQDISELGRCALEHQCEQKTNDKIEPKFHEGEWVVQGRNIMKILCVGNEYYCFETVGGYRDDMLISEIDSLYHRWTIRDAKDGDVLAIGNEYFLFKEKKENTSPVVYISHCFADSAGAFRVTNGRDCGEFLSIENGIKACPATKEQRDLLFQKMKEAGYEWDIDTKSLKKLLNGID